MLSAQAAHSGTYRALTTSTSHSRPRRVQTARKSYVVVTAYSKEDASVPDQVQEALRRAKEIAEQASELANSALRAGTAGDAEMRAVQANSRVAASAGREPSQARDRGPDMDSPKGTHESDTEEGSQMRVAYEHCKEKSDETLSDIARHCYEETAEAAGEKLGEGPWEG